MKKLLSLLVVLGLLVLGVGCAEESGTTKPKDTTTKKEGDGGNGGDDKKMSATLWAGDVEVAVGETKDVKVELKRDKYDGEVKAKITFDAKKVKVEPAEITVAEGKNDATVKVTGVAEGDATITLEITTKPADEENTTLEAKDIKVTVKKKEGGE